MAVSCYEATHNTQLHIISGFDRVSGLEIIIMRRAIIMRGCHYRQVDSLLAKKGRAQRNTNKRSEIN